MDSNGAACISEYGLETVLRDEAPPESILTNVRWMAPEVLSTKGRFIPSGGSGKAADVYSLAMVMFEVCIPHLYSPHLSLSQRFAQSQTLTNTTPFSKENSEEVVDMVAMGVRPKWPPNDPPKWLREQIEACWSQEPDERPTAFNVLKQIEASLNQEPDKGPTAFSVLKQTEACSNQESDKQPTALNVPKQIEASSNQEPDERPTAFNVLEDLSGNIHTPTSNPMSTHHREGGISNQSSSKDRTGKIGKTVRRILNSPGRALGGITGRHKLGGN